MRPSILGLVLCGILATPGVLPAAELSELKKIHILMVFDTAASDLTKSIKIDRARMENLWRRTIPSNRYSLTVLDGPKATAKDILAHYRNHPAGQDEGLVFFYAGHGARDHATRKAFLDLRKGGPLLRENLVRAMEAKKTDLVLVLTDCCSTPQSFKEALITSRSIPAPPAKELAPTVRSLLFQARGTVDVTAATDNASWSDNLEGGLFTRSLERMLTKPVTELNSNKLDFVTWREFYPRLRDDTRRLFGAWSKEMISRGEKVDEQKQEPHAFGLGKGYAVVGVENLTGKTLTYSVRWPGQQSWTEVELGPDEKKVHALPLSATQTVMPKLEAKIQGVSGITKLYTTEFVGTEEPTELLHYAKVRAR